MESITHFDMESGHELMIDFLRAMRFSRQEKGFFSKSVCGREAYWLRFL
jgi:hypothetical protein